ncbi:MAG TPA: FkbM family methyltransferase [Steroidobacteraceae bacterium]|nr:FkbM family methyltransferase [Steroidobacteraceae bacterium]
MSYIARKALKAGRLVRRHAFRRGLFYGIAAAIEHEEILRPLELRTIVDIGANIGQFSLLARALFPRAKIFAFEPQEGPAAKYRRFFHADGAVLYRSAIGSNSGIAPMYISRRHDSSSFLPVTPAMPELFPGTEIVRTDSVPIAPLREFLSPTDIVGPALLKIDVQGAELDVLRGCEDLLEKFDLLYIELSFRELYAHQPLCDDVIRYLDDQGFQTAGVANISRRGGTPIQADFLFRPKKSVAA